MNHVAGDGASPSVLSMIDMLQPCIEFDGWFQGGLLEAPCTLANLLFRGGHPVFQGAKPRRAPQ